MPSPFEVAGTLSPRDAGVRDGASLVFMRTFGMGRLPTLPHSQNARRIVPVYPWALAAYCEGGLWNASRVPWIGWFENLRDTTYLDEDGEWARNGPNLLYQPRRGDAPVAELARLPTLIRLQGARDIEIRNFELAFTAWDNDIAYDAARHVSTHLYRPDATGGEFIGKPAAIETLHTTRVRIVGNGLRHLGGTGIALIEGTRNSLVEGNLILDAGVNGIEVDSRAELLARGNLLGGTTMGPASSEQDVIENNLLARIGEKDWVGIGIRIGFTKDLVVRNNEISQSSYSAISSGGTLRNCWRASMGAADPSPTIDCWNRAGTLIESNVIDRPMARSIDGAAIYVNGQQPGTYVRNNVIRNMPLLEDEEGGAIVTALYFDTGSTGMVVRFNAIPDPDGAGVFFNPPPPPAPGASQVEIARYRVGRILVDEADVRRRNRGVHQHADPPGLEPRFAASLETVLDRWLP